MTDLILVCQSNVMNVEETSNWPLDRLETFDTLVYPRLVYHGDRFVTHLDLINQAIGRKSYDASSFAERRGLMNIWHLPSMSGVHLANFLLGHGISVKLINNLDSEWDLFEAAYSACSQPPLVGISSTFYLGAKQVGRIAKRLLKLDPAMEIVVGGAWANSVADSEGMGRVETVMRKYGISHLLHAFNPEADLCELIKARKGTRDFSAINNLCTMDGSQFVANSVKWNEPLLDEAPALWDRLDLPFVNRTLQIRTASGCPFSCAFCSYPTTARGWKTLDVDAVRAHLNAVKRIPGIEQLIFIDDTFNVPQQRFKELLKVFREYDFEWFSFLRVQYVDEEIVGLMKKSGCAGVYLGIESASDKILQNMNKKATKADFARGLALLDKYGIPSLSAFVLGFPGETEETLEENMRFIEENPVPFYSLKEFFYMENTKVHRERDQWGLTGMGAKWAHATMNSDAAGRHKLEMFKRITASRFVDPDTSLWYMAYLRDQGLSDGAIATIQEELTGIMRRQLGGDFSPDHGAVERIAAAARTSAQLRGAAGG
ncbi:MAG: radical SAM protein [Rhodospirillaceae bacterium]|nr:radical SAM protein [Rhodospirillales bacterium]